MGTAQMLTQDFHSCTNLHSRDNPTIMRHGLLNGLQACSYGARTVLGTMPNRHSIINIVKQDAGCVLAPPLFNVCLDSVIRQLLPQLQRLGVTICYKIDGQLTHCKNPTEEVLM